MDDKIHDHEIPSSEHIIAEYLAQGASIRAKFFEKYSSKINQAAKIMALSIANGNKILLCGNGGSAADAQHIAGELVNRFLLDRPPLPAISLSTDTSVITAIGNDFGFEEIFSKQVRALGQSGDILIGISTSGNSDNIVHAFNEAKSMDITTVGILGKGGELAKLSDILLAVPHPLTPIVQEIHITIGHLLCRLIDYYLFENAQELGLSV